MKKSSELRALARAQLKGKWLEAVGVYIVYGLIMSASSVVLGLGPLILGGPMTLGLLGYFLLKAKGEDTQFENLFDGFKQFGSGLVLFLLQTLFLFLWSLLLFIPGIIKCFSYSMSFFILKDNPEIKASEAITRSRKMMNGNKWKLFCLCFSFIGWAFLCTFSLGIGYFWLMPYMYTSVANFYKELKDSQQAQITA